MSVARRVSFALVAAAVVGGAAAAAFGVGGGSADPGERPSAAQTTTVTRRTLVDQTKVPAKVAYGNAAPVVSQAAGTVTWLPAPGTVVSRGQPLLRADDQPVVLLYGALPMYRQLTAGAKGEDVKQFAQNLKALGYSGFPVGTEYTEATATAVKRWQKALKRTETGSVEVADVIYAETELRVAAQSVRVGAKAAGAVLTATGTGRVVMADVPRPDERLAKPRNAVTVILPDGKELAGEVSTVGTGAEPSTVEGQQPPQNQGGGETIPIVVTVKDQGALPADPDARVTVKYVAETRADVLTVPVQALLALGDGGFGLELRDGGTRRVVPVRTGLFADGQVEVTGDGIAEGVTVGVAA
ncbi:peptidoglycan-binding protein [Virgisporangium aliadipatigenens]|uniref:Peptidoglycan-binding protein n=1 Tax=Virgisporangium aliadipatigenens TaxID=741659 RepID=A0A8J3YP31_9ACTN|nr:peptidoglycan-binding protein [Virgisporangium aliadipatigenens]GIJ49109.1 peptidoglycan-binding protein [Virgisporangium aliadipatigenens]